MVKKGNISRVLMGTAGDRDFDKLAVQKKIIIINCVFADFPWLQNPVCFIKGIFSALFWSQTTTII